MAKKNNVVGTVDFTTGKYYSNKKTTSKRKKKEVIGEIDFTTREYASYEDIAPVKTNANKKGNQAPAPIDYSTVNIDMLGVEISDLDKQLSNLEDKRKSAVLDSPVRIGRRNRGGRTKNTEKYDEQIEELKKQIASKKMVYGEAERYQKSVSLTSNAIKSKDFNQYSTYGSAKEKT